jgi:ribose/xylose/arabinose/galactoside ABC-type transport system permease subunit
MKKPFRWSLLFTDYALFWLLVITVVFFTAMQGAFLSFGNVMNILKNASYMVMMVTGLTWVIAAGEMDCSFPDVASCSSMVFAWFVANDYTMIFSISMALLAGIVCGITTSFFVVKCGFHSLITTIAVATIARSAASAINGGMPLVTPAIKSASFYRFINSNIQGFSMNFIIAVLIFVLLFIIQERTRYGQHIYAVGENRQAVTEAGIKSGRIVAGAFILSAGFAGLAGIVTVFMVYGCGMPRMGTSFFLDGFTIVFLGATAFKHGKTNVLGTLIGGIMLAAIVNGMTLIGGTFAASQITKGVFLVIGIFISALGQRQNRKRMGLLKYE